MFFNINLFVQNFKNNQLNNGQIKAISVDEYINQILEKTGNDSQTIEKLIIDTSMYLPSICESFIKFYHLNQEIAYQVLKNVFIKKVLNRKNSDIFSFMLNVEEITYRLYCIFQDVHNHYYDNSYLLYYRIYNEEQYKKAYIERQKKIQDIYEIKEENRINNINFCIFHFSLKRWKKIFIFLTREYMKSESDIKVWAFFVETLAYIYQRYIQNYFVYQDHKCFINIIAKLFIYVFTVKCYIQAIEQIDNWCKDYINLFV